MSCRHHMRNPNHIETASLGITPYTGSGLPITETGPDSSYYNTPRYKDFQNSLTLATQMHETTIITNDPAIGIYNNTSEPSTARQLATLLHSPAAGDEEVIHQQVAQIDVHEPLFSGRMTELYIAMGEDRIDRRNLRNELNADRSKTTTPENWRDVAEEIIRNLLRDYSLRLLDEYRSRTWNRTKGRYVIKKAEAFIKQPQ